MGVFAKIAKIGSCVWGGAKTVVKGVGKVVGKVATVMIDGGKKVYAAVQSGYEIFTGRDKEREAEKLLDRLQKRARSKEQEFQDFADKIQKRIDLELEKLNDMRDKLNYGDFRRFERLCAMFANWDVAPVRKERSEKLKEHHVEPVKERKDLFKIDFRNHPIKSNLKALCSLGFWSRKEAKETLLKVQEEEHRLDLDIKRLDAEKNRLSLLADALEQVVAQIIRVHQEYYHRLLDEVDYSVNFLRCCYFLQTNETPPSKMDIAMLPLRHIECLNNADKATRILCEIGNYRFIENTQFSVTKREQDFDKCKEQLNKMQHEFAA